MDDRVIPFVERKPLDLEKFVEDMLEHARELHAILRDNADDDKIKDRITCLKYLEDVVKTYLILKKASTDDPSAAGSAVRKYAGAFAKNAAGGGKKAPRRRTTAADLDEPDPDGDDA